MKRVFLIIILCMCLIACGKTDNTYSTEPSQTNNSKKIPKYEKDISKIIKQINQYMETTYKMANFAAVSEDNIWFANSTIPYSVYYVGCCEPLRADEYLLVKLDLKDGKYTDAEYEFAIECFALDVYGELTRKIPYDRDNENLYESIINDTTLEKIGEGEFTIGDPYHPTFEDYDQKEEVLNEIKKVLRNKYFTEISEPSEQPVFYDHTKAKEVYLLDFDEGCVKYNQYRVVIYTEDGYVYQGVLFYRYEDERFICQESGTGYMIYYKESDLENPKDKRLKVAADYIERIKKYSICKITE